MDGPHNAHAWAGFDAIPFKGQDEKEQWPAEGFDYEAGFTFTYQVGTVLIGKFQKVPYQLDAARWWREAMHPRDYLNAPYDELWVRSMTAGLYFAYLDSDGSIGISLEELIAPVPYISQVAPDGTPTETGEVATTSAQALDDARLVRELALKQKVPGFKPLQQSTGYEPDLDNGGHPDYVEGEQGPEPKYTPGAKVRAVLQTGSGHSREYPVFRGRVGTIVTAYGAASAPLPPGSFNALYHGPYPDVACRAIGGQKEQAFYLPLYSVRFAASELYGHSYTELDENGEPLEHYVYADLWEPYLELIEDAPPSNDNNEKLESIWDVIRNANS